MEATTTLHNRTYVYIHLIPMTLNREGESNFSSTEHLFFFSFTFIMAAPSSIGFPVAIFIIVLVIVFGVVALGIIKRKLKKDEQRREEHQRREAVTRRRENARNLAAAVERIRRSPPAYEAPTTTTPANGESSTTDNDADHLSITMPPPAYKDHRQDRRVPVAAEYSL